LFSSSKTTDWLLREVQGLISKKLYYFSNYGRIWE
jgi:hypothetical protein